MLLVDERGPVRVLTLARPERRNALSRELVGRLTDAVGEAEADEAVRVIVLAAQGDAFCAGLDLHELGGLPEAGEARHREDAAALRTLYERLHGGPTPVVAAVEGAAVGGGAGLVTACDVVVAGTGAFVAYPEVRLGLVAALVAFGLVQAVGPGRARELMVSGRRVDAQQCLRLGLFHEGVDADAALPRALERAERIADGAPAALAASKALLARIVGSSAEEAWALAEEVNAGARATAEAREGVTAYLERRTPAWRERG